MLPNVITVLRLILVPFILWLASEAATAPLAVGLALFLVAGLTDWLDGYLARRRRLVTAFGTFMDPITDKVLVLGAMFVFAHHHGLLPMWLVLVNLFRELLVSGVRQVKAVEGELVGANWMGRVKFWLQTALISGIFLYLILASRGVNVSGGQRLILWGATLVTAVSLGFAVVFVVWYRKEIFRSRAA